MGKVPEFTEKIDLYALGLILLELSTSINKTTKHEKMSAFDNLKNKRQI
jgi:hypothetical protein